MQDSPIRRFVKEVVALINKRGKAHEGGQSSVNNDPAAEAEIIVTQKQLDSLLELLLL